ncbi:putative peptidoglycan-binding domain-containing protein [Holospora curviuscula]|uniref:Putative Peptidoglycan domain protein n=1 Tax=Holospora curviuscula TaxID=1082868 RepID=A0A2S5R782_9PROT|nr:putative peptidoglycan-binding domain-containing protein [Holospora curviuscula]PPE03147.1 putative Peptidoglycan domain protein [Holospora curviuscula]
MVTIRSSWAHKLVQQALKSTGQNIAENGVLGPITLTALNKADLKDLRAALKSEAAEYYRTLDATQPRRAKFLKRWLKRAYA